MFTLERAIAIIEEINKLMHTKSIREVQYPEWLENVVLAQKHNGKWRLCIDFTDLNKAYPKDYFSLPIIDLLVDATTVFQILIFMAAFSRYNQVCSV